MSHALLDRLSDRVSYRRLLPGLQPFYKAFPYTGSASPRSVDDRGCVDIDMGFFYNRIPKAANSTVVSSLASLKMQREIGSKEGKRLFKRPSALSAGEVAMLEHLFCFSVVRNPYSRTLSAYLDKVKRKQDDGRWRGKHRDFEGFLRWLREGALYSNAHWAPQSSLLLLPLQRFEFIGKVESLEHDLKIILQRLDPISRDATGTSDGIRSVHHHATGAQEKLNHYYNETTQELVLEMYADDFDHFQYSRSL